MCVCDGSAYPCAACFQHPAWGLFALKDASGVTSMLCFFPHMKKLLFFPSVSCFPHLPRCVSPLLPSQFDRCFRSVLLASRDASVCFHLFCVLRFCLASNHVDEYRFCFARTRRGASLLLLLLLRLCRLCLCVICCFERSAGTTNAVGRGLLACACLRLCSVGSLMCVRAAGGEFGIDTATRR